MSQYLLSYAYQMLNRIKQWSGRKEKWCLEWRDRTDDEVLRELAHLPLWYNGGIDTIISLPPTSNGNVPHRNCPRKQS